MKNPKERDMLLRIPAVYARLLREAWTEMGKLNIQQSDSLRVQLIHEEVVSILTNWQEQIKKRKAELEESDGKR